MSDVALIELDVKLISVMIEVKINKTLNNN